MSVVENLEARFARALDARDALEAPPAPPPPPPPSPLPSWSPWRYVVALLVSVAAALAFLWRYRSLGQEPPPPLRRSPRKVRFSYEAVAPERRSPERRRDEDEEEEDENFVEV